MIKVDSDVLTNIQNELTKQDIFTVISELGITEPDLTTRYSQLVDIVVKDCNDNGVPEWGDCSKLLRKFLITAKITDINGELITAETLEASPEESKTDVEYPECFGLADDKDPACLRCKVLEECKKSRLESLPPCFGKSYSETAPECRICMEKNLCKEKVE